MNEVVHTSPTIGSNVEEVVWKNIHFIMWDLGGQQSLRAAWSTYYSNTEVSLFIISLIINFSSCNTHVHETLVKTYAFTFKHNFVRLQFVILVIDSTDRERLSVTREELYKMLNHEELSSAAVLIYANKQDVKDCMSAAEISRHLDLTSIKNQQWHIQSCCALTGEG